LTSQITNLRPSLLHVCGVRVVNFLFEAFGTKRMLQNPSHTVRLSAFDYSHQVEVPQRCSSTSSTRREKESADRNMP
jgi:hypothetical protein